ncbi:MAG: ribosome-binding factor A [Bacteroidales bacterium]|nr:ribosome-binding factor A [Porphyromonas sp.]MDD6934302.1 ribosome-binding factor A [Bacteroidales bacterium]MDY3102032.1 ribosome-binding factor A [Porphyromonas sp.]
MNDRRISKIARLIQKSLGELFRKQTQMSPGVLISVTRVVPSPDLSFCKVYLSIFPSEKAGEVHEQIRRATAQIRYALGVDLGSQLRVIPELVFIVDDTLDYLDNIDRLLAK